MDSSQREKEGFTIIVYFFVDDGFQVSVPAKQLNGHLWHSVSAENKSFFHA